ncbi:MAG: GH25 family lysozyme [Anaerovoracaceae bacterium]
MRRHTRIATIMLAILMIGGTVSAHAATLKSPFGSTGYTSYQIPDSKSNHLIVNAVDVSVFQTRKGKNSVSDVNWSTLKKAGVDAAVTRIGGTYGRKTDGKYKYYKDVSLKDQYTKATKAGMMTGAYWLAQSMTESDAVKEAKLAVTYLKDNGIEPEDMELPVYMDYEFVSGSGVAMTSKTLTKSKATKAAVAFCKTIESYGYKPGIYASTSFYDKYIDASKLSSSTSLWIAQYYYKCEYTKHDYDMWQYSSKGKISKMFIDFTSSPIDCNFLYLDKSRKASSSKDIAGCSLSYNKYINYVSSGTQHKASVTVKDSSGKKLTAGKDYTVHYLKNTKSGTAYMYISGMGSYTGYKVASYYIKNTDLSKYPMGSLRSSISFAEESGLGFADDGKYVTGICGSTPVQAVLDSVIVPEGYTADIRKTANSIITSGTVKAGYYLCICDETGIIRGAAELIVDGDIDGDGSLTENDADLMAQALVGRITLSERQLVAAGTDKPSLEALSSMVIKLGERASEANVLSDDADVDDEKNIEAYSETEAEDEAEHVEAYSEDAQGAAPAEAASKSGLTVSASRTSVYRGETVTLKIATASRVKANAALITASPGKLMSCVDTSSARTYFYKGKLVMYQLDGAKLGGTVKLKATSAGNAEPVLSGKLAMANGTSEQTKNTAAIKISSAKAPAIKKLSAASKGFKVTWARSDKAPFSGYQIRYSRYSSMKSAKTVTVKSSSAVSKSISGLSAKRKYYVQVRGYVSSTSYASGWSSRKSVTTK